MSTAIHPKGPRPAPAAGAAAWATTYLASTTGSKLLVAVTGASLVGFVAFHLIGNLKIFTGAEGLNAYAAFLKHDLGVLIWFARGGLLTLFLVHLGLALRLKLLSMSARPVGYAHRKYAQASPAATTMAQTGIVIGLFTLFHLAHYTFAWVHDVQRPDGTWTNYLELKDAAGRHDVYAMMVAGFTTWWISALYLLAQVVLFVHLSHGIASVFQTLGLVGRRFTPAAKALGYAVAGAILVGNCAIVIAVWAGYVK